MDLHALATHLSKLKLSERLFLEKDLLPEDLVRLFIAIFFSFANFPSTQMYLIMCYIVYF